MGSNLPVPSSHMEVLYRQTFNTLGKITAAGLTQDNRVGNAQKVNNARLDTNTNKGILAGSVVAVAADGYIGPAAGDSTTFDKVVGVAVNDAIGQPFESSSALSSNCVVYAHGSGTVFRTDIYETKGTDGTADITYTAGDLVFSSQNGILTNEQGLDNTALIGTTITTVGVVLSAPSSDAFMTIQMKI